VVLTADGETLVFVTTDGWLKRMVRRTGIVEPLASDTGLFTTPAVAPDGTVAFSRGGRLVLRAPAGPERDLVVADAAARDAEFTWPAFSQDGSVVAFRTRAGATSAGSNRLEAVRTDGTGRRVLVEGATQVVYLSHDRIVFEQDGTLRTAGFDASALALRGTPVRLGEKVSLNQTGGIAASVARTGAILMAPPAVLSSRLVWVTSSGVERVIHSPPRGFQNPRVSTPGGLIAFSETGTIWTLDPVRGTFARVSAANEPLVGFPVWSVDGTSLYYRSAEGIQLHRADGEGVRKTLANTGSSDYPASLSPDGSTLVILRITAETAGDLYRTPAGGGDLTPLLVTKAYEGGPQISPDGKWLLYVTNESGGRLEVFLRPFGGADRKWLVSVGGGLHPLWSRDGRQIFYRSGQQMLAVDFSAAPDVRLGTPRVLFDRRYEFGPNLTFPNYALSADGRDFLMVQQEPGGRHLNLVLNWFQNLAR
jgi:Tol biopolymer transport system component